MSNMSYCRFQNTARDLDECKGALDEILDLVPDGDEPVEPLSQDETRAAQRLVETALETVLRLAEEAGLEVGDLDGPEVITRFGQIIKGANATATEYRDAAREEERS